MCPRLQLAGFGQVHLVKATMEKRLVDGIGNTYIYIYTFICTRSHCIATLQTEVLPVALIAPF